MTRDDDREILIYLPGDVLRDRGGIGRVVGDIGRWSLNFTTSDDWGDAGRWDDLAADFDFDVRPLDREYSYTSTVPSVVSTDDGVTAVWSAPQELRGRHRLHGFLYCDLLYGGAPVAGEITRIRRMTETFTRSDDSPEVRRWTERLLRDVDAIDVSTLDEGLVSVPNPHRPGRFSLRPPNPWRCDTGFLLDVRPGGGGG